jgi:FAD synthase
MNIDDITTLKSMKLFHGSKTLFSTFDIGTVNSNGFGRGMGFHFVNEMSLARQYAGPDGFVYVAEISVTNPLIYGEQGSRGGGLDRDRVTSLGYDSYMFKQRRYIELVIFDTSQIKVIDVISMKDT